MSFKLIDLVYYFQFICVVKFTLCRSQYFLQVMKLGGAIRQEGPEPLNQLLSSI